jgi:iron complex transport system substrate-binding protein
MKRSLRGLCGLLLIATLALAACGDATNTAVPATTVATATTAATTTAPATTVAATTRVATTVATTTQAATTVAATTAATTTGAATQAGDLTITDKSGTTTTLTKKPERIVCLFSSCVDNLAELGIEPVGVDKIDGLVVSYPHFYADKGKNIKVLGGNGYEVNIEEIASLKPDLVVGFAGPMDGLKASLKNIAPLWLVYPQSYQEALEVFRTMGRITGRSTQAEAAIGRFQAKLAAYKAKAPKDKSLMVGIYDGKTFYAYVQSSILCGLLGEVTNCPWKAEQATATGVVPYSTEQLLKADPDALFIINFPGAPNKLTDEIKNDPVGKELKAVKTGQLFDASLWYQSYGTRSLSFVLDDAMTKTYPQVFPKPVEITPSATSPNTGGVATATGSDLTITDTTGTKITLTKRPERIFCISATCMDWLAELGMQPVGITPDLQANVTATWLFGDKGKSIFVSGGNTNEPNLEDIAKTKPDLVIGYAFSNDNLRESLKNIAPIANFYPHNISEALDQFKAFGRLVGKGDMAEATASRTLARLEAYKAKSPRSKSVLIVPSLDQKTLYIKTNQTVQCSILNELSKCNWAMPKNATGLFAAFGIAQISLEEVLTLDPDYIYSFSYPGAPALADALKDNPFWKSLKAVQNKQVGEVDGFLWGDGNGPRGINRLMDDAMTRLYPDIFPKPLP